MIAVQQTFDSGLKTRDEETELELQQIKQDLAETPVNPSLLEQLLQLGHNREIAIKALRLCNSVGLQEAQSVIRTLSTKSMPKPNPRVPTPTGRSGIGGGNVVRKPSFEERSRKSPARALSDRSSSPSSPSPTVPPPRLPPRTPRKPTPTEQVQQMFRKMPPPLPPRNGIRKESNQSPSVANGPVVPLRGVPIPVTMTTERTTAPNYIFSVKYDRAPLRAQYATSPVDTSFSPSPVPYPGAVLTESPARFQTATSRRVQQPALQYARSPIPAHPSPFTVISPAPDAAYPSPSPTVFIAQSPLVGPPPNEPPPPLPRRFPKEERPNPPNYEYLLDANTTSNMLPQRSPYASPLPHAPYQQLSPAAIHTSTSTASPTSASSTSPASVEQRVSPLPQRKNKRTSPVRRVVTPRQFIMYMEQHVEYLEKSRLDRENRYHRLVEEMKEANLSQNLQQKALKMLAIKESQHLRAKRQNIDKSMFNHLKVLGRGAFGSVSLVLRKDNDQLYAMKTLRKQHIALRNQGAHVRAERDALAEAADDNDWVVKLYFSFQDENCVYFILEYIPGGDLMSLLEKFGRFSEQFTRFYIAEIVLAIESVHRMGFIHRDIKPDNVLIDRDGHIKLTDFGLCTGFRWNHDSKYYESSSGTDTKSKGDPTRRRSRQQNRSKARSLVGTPNYISPEVLVAGGEGYTQSCDWWSVGVIAYEALVGRPPFYAETPSETQQNVIAWRRTLTFPPEPKLSLESKNLIQRLCCDASDRLGAHGALEIKTHPFFRDTNWVTLRLEKAPYIPEIKHRFDTSNFENYDEFENSVDNGGDNSIPPGHAFYDFTFKRFFQDPANSLDRTSNASSENSRAPNASRSVYL